MNTVVYILFMELSRILHRVVPSLQKKSLSVTINLTADKPVALSFWIELELRNVALERMKHP